MNIGEAMTGRRKRWKGAGRGIGAPFNRSIKPPLMRAFPAVEGRQGELPSLNKCTMALIAPPRGNRAADPFYVRSPTDK
jgi:hypothetical protein